ncbi:hypothetical protein Cylst_2608 [Cylindrospermum stagnale PCC 7417]|uniref:Uncharacterized protein n=1 Tax=Cylindrospermum stagnale PCC 7417 TaxID=56107 RepID=K9WYB6_9NOST|nr:hypothetical protein [Cylindrospermum stagnale]AFZ24814.1 hypothetical protein Cylst_2608 [Cylindrospermum stagnale PCC 7417]
MFWRILDVKNNQPNFPLAIVVLPPKVEQDNYQQIEKAYQKNIATYQEKGADIVKENEVESWVSKQIINVHLTLPIRV